MNLTGEVPTDGSGLRLGLVMNLYCWPCRAPHALPLADAERIVYALGAAERDGWDDEHMPSGQEHPTCLLEMLALAGSGEGYAEHVEQGIECRRLADG